MVAVMANLSPAHDGYLMLLRFLLLCPHAGRGPYLVSESFS